MIAVAFGGVWSMFRVPLDAVPDITNNQVQVITTAPNLGTEDVEQFITVPIELEMGNLPGIKDIRSISRFGLSIVTVIFEDDMGTFLPRQLVNEKLATIQKEIPNTFGQPEAGPISTGLGEIYQYTLEVEEDFKDQYSITKLRTIQDWIVKRQMALVQGVVEINSFGGKVKQYQVAVKPDELRALDITITDVFNALQNNNANTGGAYIEKDHQAHFIRGEGTMNTTSDIAQTVVKNVNGRPILIEDIGTVNIGHQVRYGAVTKNGKGEAVGGMVMMMKGANSNDVIEDVKKRIDKIQSSLPEGISIIPFLDRSKLISKTTGTITTNLIEGGLIVIFILVVLLGNWRGGLIVASTIPLSLLFAFIMMYLFDVSANLMSLGAIDFGIIVDGAVIIVEGTVLLLLQSMKGHDNPSQEKRDAIAATSSKKMMNAAFFGQLIILIVFVPILTLEGVEGKMFQPMALTFMFAMIGAMILCLTYVPMMSASFLKIPTKSIFGFGNKIVHFIERKFAPFLKRVLICPVYVLSGALIGLVFSVIIFLNMGGEFVPQLDEGDIAFHIITKPGSSLSEAVKRTTEVEQRLLKKFPEIETMVSKIGVADVPTDPMPMDLADSFIILKAPSEWETADTKEGLIKAFKEEVEKIPGLNYEFSQPIEMRFNELISGVREDIAIKVFGDDLEILAQKASQIKSLIQNIKGVGDIKVEATTGLPQIVVQYNRSKLAQYGLQIADLNPFIQSAFGGGKSGVIYEGDRRFDLVVKLDSTHRKNIGNVENLYINLPNGHQIPLKELATISYKDGPMQISRDQTSRRVYVGVNVRNRDIASLVKEIQNTLDESLDLPPGYYIRYGGTFENLERASNKMKWVVPIALFLIFILIYFALRSIAQTLVIYIAIPLAAVGGILALWIRDMPFSISAGIGFIVLFGVAVLNGLVLMSSFNEIKASSGHIPLRERIIQATRSRIRPILLTALTDILGFLPMAISTSAGAEVQRPLATVVIGGLLTASILTLFVIPVLYQWIEKNQLDRTSKVPVGTATILLLLIAPAAMSQNTTDYDVFENKALQEYNILKADSLGVQKAETLLPTQWDIGNTTVFTSGEEIGPSGGVFTIVGLQLNNVKLFETGPNRVAIEALKAKAEARYTLSKAKVKTDLLSVYAANWFDQQSFELVQKLDSIFIALSEKAAIAEQNEDISQLELLQIQNLQASTTLQLQRLQYEAEASSVMMGLYYGDTVIANTRDSSWIRSLGTADSSQYGQHPLLQQTQAEIQYWEAQSKAKKAALRPSLNAQYGWQTIGGSANFHAYQLGINIPLFYGPAKAQAKAAKVEALSNAERLSFQEKQLQTKIAKLKIEMNAAWQQHQYYQSTAIPLANKQMNANLKAYEAGAIGYYEFTQTMQQVVQQKLEALNVFEKWCQKAIMYNYLKQ